MATQGNRPQGFGGPFLALAAGAGLGNPEILGRIIRKLRSRIPPCLPLKHQFRINSTNGLCVSSEVHLCKKAGNKVISELFRGRFLKSKNRLYRKIQVVW